MQSRLDHFPALLSRDYSRQISATLVPVAALAIFSRRRTLILALASVCILLAPANAAEIVAIGLYFVSLIIVVSGIAAGRKARALQTEIDQLRQDMNSLSIARGRLFMKELNSGARAHRRRVRSKPSETESPAGDEARRIAAKIAKLQAETKKTLQRLGCTEVGFMDKFETQELLLAFTHRGQQLHFTASAKGWAQMWLRKNPYNDRVRRSKYEYEQDALRQGHIAVNSIIRDWVKGQCTAIETGVLSFEAVFMPFMLTSDGRRLIERVQELLPKPTEEKIIALPSR